MELSFECKSQLQSFHVAFLRILGKCDSMARLAEILQKDGSIVLCIVNYWRADFSEFWSGATRRHAWLDGGAAVSM